jgi:hypothetical protein
VAISRTEGTRIEILLANYAEEQFWLLSTDGSTEIKSPHNNGGHSPVLHPTAKRRMRLCVF